MKSRFLIKISFSVLSMVILCSCTSKQPEIVIEAVKIVTAAATLTPSSTPSRAPTSTVVRELSESSEQFITVVPTFTPWPILTLTPIVLPTKEFTFVDQLMNEDVTLSWLEEILAGEIVEFEIEDGTKRYVKHDFSGDVELSKLENELAFSNIFAEMRYLVDGADTLVVIVETFLPPPFEPIPTSPVGFQLLSAASFEEIEVDGVKLWKLTNEPQRLSTRFTGQGKMLEGEFLPISENSHALWAKSNSVSNGFSTKSLHGIFVGDDFPRFLVSEEIGSRGWLCANPPAEPEEDCWFYDSTFELVENPETEFYDLKIFSEGTNGYVWSREVEEISETKIFRFTSEQYELVSE